MSDAPDLKPSSADVERVARAIRDQNRSHIKRHLPGIAFDRDRLTPDDLRLAHAAIAAWNTRADGWRPIETAPKDGTPVVLYNADWEAMPVAQWMAYPGGQVVNADGEDSYMWGWGHDARGCDYGHENYWLGWDGDPMPTHWMPLPAPPEKETRDD